VCVGGGGGRVRSLKANKLPVLLGVLLGSLEPESSGAAHVTYSTMDPGIYDRHVCMLLCFSGSRNKRAGLPRKQDSIRRCVLACRCRLMLTFEMYMRSGEYIDSGLTEAAHLAWNGMTHRLPGGPPPLPHPHPHGDPMLLGTLQTHAPPTSAVA